MEPYALSDRAMQAGIHLPWAALTVWSVVNAVNLLQSIGFLSRVKTKGRAINHRIGYLIVFLAIPTTVALVSFIQTGAPWLYLAGPIIFLVFIVFMIGIDYIWKIEFRSPMRASVAAPRPA